jgi:hypothetical protein
MIRGPILFQNTVWIRMLVFVKVTVDGYRKENGL